jgi:hypothetical protein
MGCRISALRYADMLCCYPSGYYNTLLCPQDSSFCPYWRDKAGDQGEQPTRDPEQLAQQHWAYVEQVIRHEWGETENMDEEYLKALEFHYKSAFAHGFKHGKEEKQWQK